MRAHLLALAAVAGLSGNIKSAHATAITDPTGDFLAGYTGPHDADLDVTSLDVTMPTLDEFQVSATLAGPVGTTPGAFYALGVDRGAGTAGFGASFAGVVFDSVVALQQNGTGSVTLLGSHVTTTPLPAGSIAISGDTITVDVPTALLPSTGFAPDQFGFNLWPRSAPGGAGVQFVADFAPDDATITVNAVPEPASWLIMGAALLGLSLLRRRRTAGTGTATTAASGE